MSVLTEFLFAVAFGYTLAELTAGLHLVAFGRSARFAPAIRSPLAFVQALVFGAFAGPRIVLDIARRNRESGTAAPLWSVAATIVAGAWSFCAGILVMETLRDIVLAAGA